jgi:hypothetical protein
MNTAKIAAIILVIIIGLITSLNFIVKNSVSSKNAVLESYSQKDLDTNPPKKLSTGISPLKWIEKKERSLSQANMPQVNNQLDSSSTPSNDSNKMNTSTLPQFNFPQLNQWMNQSSSSSFSSRSNSKEREDYYKKIAEILARTSFTSEEINLVIKNDDGRALLLEELIEKAEQGEGLEKLKDSFYAWHQLDERVLNELNKLSPPEKTLSFHQVITNWFSYHSKIAKQFSEGNLSLIQINQLAQQFKKEAENHTIRFRQSLEISADFKNLFAFLVPHAQAITCGALIPPPFYHFGGRVIPPVHICVVPPLGIINTITPPCGGLLLFPYPVLAANPFLWKKPTIGSAVLGRSILAPGCCLGAGISPPVYCWEAIVLYFGTSLIP